MFDCVNALPSLLDIAKLWLFRDPEDRPTAKELQQHPLIKYVDPYSYKFREFLKEASEKWHKHLLETIPNDEFSETSENDYHSD